LTVTQGVIYAPEPTGRHVIGPGDPALFNVIDTAIKADRELFPTPSPLLANLRMEITLGVNHNTWVRNREANVEIYTDDPLIIHAEQQAFDVTGVVTTDRGEYSFMSRRFQIKRGSAIFIGSPDLNPTLQITGEYQVLIAARGTLDIRVSIGGTLRQPKLSLESDAQPPRTQSELLSLLAFGQTTQSLLGSAASSITSTAATSDLFGIGAQYAVRRLAGVALGVAVEQVEMQAGRAFGTDVFDITPGDVPSSNFVGTFLTQTKFEAGKYVNPRTYVSVQQQAGHVGAGVEHRTADGWQFSVSAAPRILLGEPQLNSQPYRTVQSYGGFILRDWRF
jgi:translocation and assembly module TamB